jgi:MFS family permease
VVTGLVYSAILIWRFWGFHSPSISIPAERTSPFKAVRSLPFLLLAAVFFAFCAMLWVIYAWLPTVVHERYQLNLTQSGVTSTLSLQIGSALGVLTGGFLGDWAVTKPFTSRIEVALGGVLCCSPFALLIFSTHSLFVLQVATFCFGLSAGVFIANTFSCLYDFTDRSNFSFATGCLNMLGGAGGGVAIFLAGIFKNTWGIASLMLWTLLFADGASIALIVLARRRGKQH